jgi:ankyrin repeat protein
MTIKWLCLGVSCSAMLVGLSAQTPGRNLPEDMYAAVRAGDTARVVSLLDSGTSVNDKERRGGATPLMLAAAFGSLDTMRQLIGRGADVNARSAAGATALLWVATDIEKTRLLLEHGADPNVESTLGRSALLLAAMSDRSHEIVRLLLSRGANPRIVSADKTTTLLAAAIGNDTETIREFVAADIDVNAADVTGRTPLMVAASNGNLAAVKLLLAKGANVNAVSGPPGAKVKNGTIALGRFTALLMAAPYGPLDVVKTLIAAGADIDARDARGMTPLMLAVATDHGDVEIVKALLAKGADVHVRSDAGETAGDWAIKSGATRSLAALKRAGAPLSPPPWQDIPKPSPVAHRVAVERGVALLERASGTFFVNGACGACHAQNVTDFAVASARTRGIQVNQEAGAQRASGAAAAFAATASGLLERVDGPAVDIQLYTLASLAAAAHPPDRGTDALVFNVVAQQLRDGRWHIGGIPRPPIEDGDVSRTALAIRGLQAYAIPGRGAELSGRVSAAMAWLRAAKAVSTEDHAFRLLGLSWGGADDAVLQRAAKGIVALQHADGGWSQRSEMTSDPYATGLTIFALREGGALGPRDPAIQRGTSYLLSTQRPDGSWYVRSRSPKFQPYFAGGFPYEHNQWISAMATGWATAALASGLDGTTTAQH